jgi:hypothetical protein
VEILSAFCAATQCLLKSSEWKTLQKVTACDIRTQEGLQHASQSQMMQNLSGQRKKRGACLYHFLTQNECNFSLRIIKNLVHTSMIVHAFFSKLTKTRLFLFLSAAEATSVELQGQKLISIVVLSN